MSGKNPAMHFEIPYEDFERVHAFLLKIQSVIKSVYSKQTTSNFLNGFNQK